MHGFSWDYASQVEIKTFSNSATTPQLYSSVVLSSHDYSKQLAELLTKG